jgi:hypothetical protein
VNVGLPGTGLGSLLYLLLALAMPFRHLYRTARGTAAAGDGRLVARQTALAAGVLAAIWATAAGVGGLLRWVRGDGGGGGAAGAVVGAVGEGDTALIRGTVVVLTLLALAGLLVAIEALGLLVGRARDRRAGAGSPRAATGPVDADPGHDRRAPHPRSGARSSAVGSGAGGPLAGAGSVPARPGGSAARREGRRPTWT